MSSESLSKPLFDFDATFEVDDYMYLYADIFTHEAACADLASLTTLVGLNGPARILDLACGFGRHANVLAQRGHRVTGVDLMPGFIDIARSRAAEFGVAVDYRQGDMRQIDFVEEFDLVIMFGVAFGYFDDEQNLQVLRNIRRALKDGGLLVFDTHNRDTLLKSYPAFNLIEKGQNFMFRRSTLDMSTGRWNSQRIFFRDGQTRYKPSSLRVYNATEIRALLDSAGLRLRALHGGLDGRPLTVDCTSIAVVAEKPVPPSMNG